MRLDGKVALITGGASGMGKVASELFSAEGAAVVLTDLNDEAGAATASGIDAAGGTALYVHADVSKEAEAKAMVDAALERFGRLDVLYNNAGVMLPDDGSVDSTDEAIWDLTLAVNVKGVAFGCKYGVPAMIAGGGGSIINTGSVNSLVSEPFLSIYAATKGGILMLSKSIALDYAKQGIRCNCLCPGWVDTPVNYAHAEMLGGLEQVYATIDSFQPIGRPGEPREIANVVLFLASDESSFMTGSAVVADGAMTAQ